LRSHIPGDTPIDGIAFSTTIHTGAPTTAAPNTKPRSERYRSGKFFLPLESLRCYESYDCTGQQLIEAGSVLITRRAREPDLQTAEADGAVDLHFFFALQAFSMHTSPWLPPGAFILRPLRGD